MVNPTVRAPGGLLEQVAGDRQRQATPIGVIRASEMYALIAESLAGPAVCLSSRNAHKRPDAATVDRLGEPVRLALGDDDVGVVEEPVDSCRGESPREDRVEPRRMQVRGHDERALLIGGVDQAIERLGLVGAGGQQADVVDDDQLGADDPLDDLAGRGVDPRAGDRGRQRLSSVNQETRRSRSIAAWAMASAKCDLPVPDGPTRTRFSARPIQSSDRSAH